MKWFNVVIVIFHTSIICFCLWNCREIFKLNKQGKKNRVAFKKIQKVMDQAIMERLTPEQLYFRLIQVRETLDQETIESTQISCFINDIKKFK